MNNKNKTSENAEDSSFFFLKKTEEILDQMGADINEPTRVLLKTLASKIDKLLYGSSDLSSSQSTGQVRLNELGVPMHPLEIEVDDMIKQAKQGNRVFPAYNRADDETPLKYLEQYYGKYLKAFNGQEDYLYQHQLQAIDSKFRNNLRTWLERREENIKDYVPGKSQLIDKEYEQLKAISLDDVPSKKKIFNLIQAKNAKDKN